jgi:hypothetical protein
LKPRFQADNDLRGSIRAGVLRREPSIDFQSALAASLDGIPDPEVLGLAMVHGRILISHDFSEGWQELRFHDVRIKRGYGFNACRTEP